VPTYQYRCTECSELTEAVQGFHDDPLTVCPHCSGALRKLFTPAAVVFKGSGFYKTDSRSGSSKSSTPAATPAPATSTATGSSETTAPSAPAADAAPSTPAPAAPSTGGDSGGKVA
jgi:putative FmdB family regulatory protein